MVTFADAAAWSTVAVALLVGAVPSTRNSTVLAFSTLPLLSVANYSILCSPSPATLIGVLSS